MAGIKLKERFIKEQFCEKVGKNIFICQQYHPIMNVKVGEEYCNYEICDNKDCPYHQKDRKI